LEVNKADAEWSGGKVRARISAKFLPRPAYDISAELDRINLSQLPGTGRIGPNGWPARRWTLHLRRKASGREELLAHSKGGAIFI